MSVARFQLACSHRRRHCAGGIMTSPPDVQNVPDIWTLLEDVVLDGGCGALKNGTVRRIILALTQRDRFVLVPLEPTPEIEHAWYNGPTSTHNRFREHWRNAL